MTEPARKYGNALTVWRFLYRYQATRPKAIKSRMMPQVWWGRKNRMRLSGFQVSLGGGSIQMLKALTVL
ncbi:hypothetical protein D3C72_1791620 [compost metagenome]